MAEFIQEKNIEVLVNNAGFGVTGLYHEADLTKMEQLVKVNILAPMIHYKHFFGRNLYDCTRECHIFISKSISENIYRRDAYGSKGDRRAGTGSLPWINPYRFS